MVCRGPQPMRKAPGQHLSIAHKEREKSGSSIRINMGKHGRSTKAANARAWAAWLSAPQLTQ